MDTLPSPDQRPPSALRSLPVVRALAGILAFLCLLLANRVSFEALRYALMGAIALAAIFWSVPRPPARGPSGSAVAFGAGLIAFILWRLAVAPGALAIGLAPLPLGIGVMLLKGGWPGLITFWREGIILLGVTASPFVETLVLELCGLDLAPTTAQFTAGLLRLFGWNAGARDVIVSLPDAWIVVSQGCSGLKTTYFLVGFSIVLLLIYPIPGWKRKALVVLTAAVVGYIVNAARVAILALMAGPGHEGAFHFWHVKQGAMVFEIIAVAVYLGIVYFLMPGRPVPVPPPPRA